VLVHCERSVSRSSTIILAYLMDHKRWTVLQTFEYLLTKRQEASPNHALLLQLVRHEHELAKINGE
jgi:protein-tyrosine phosphatase